MSEDAKVTKHLMQIAQDGREGYAKGAEDLAKSDRPQFAVRFRELSEQRERFVRDLTALATEYGDQLEAGSSVAGAVHRGWMGLRHAVTGSGPEAVLKTAEQGEEHAISAYQEALQEEVSPHLISLVQNQLVEIEAARSEVHGLLEQVNVEA